MKAVLKFVSAVALGMVGVADCALAGPVMHVPEPSSVLLVGAALAGVVALSRKGKK